MAEESTIQYLTKHGLNEREARKCFTKEPQVFEHISKEDVLSHVKDTKCFLKSFDILKDNPFAKSAYGENTQEMFIARKKLAEGFQKIMSKEYTKDALHDFAAWSVFNANPTTTYLTASKLHYFCIRWGIDKGEFFKYTSKLPNTTMYTYCEIRRNEMAIQEMLQKTRWLGKVGKSSNALDATQNAAMCGIIQKPFCALRGGAGVGKTVVVSEIVKHMMLSVQVLAVAYTNKAKRCIAKKLEEFGIDGPTVIVSTIHSLIMHLKSSQYKEAFIVIDESSMVDIDTLGELAKMIMKGIASFQVCFVGDDFQLSPVGRGEFFRQLVTHPNYSFALTKCYRADNQDLFDAFQMIRNGTMPSSTPSFEVVYVESDKELNSYMGKFIHANANAYQYVAWQNKDVYKYNKWVQEALLRKGLVGQEEWKGYRANDVVCYRGEKKDNLSNALIGKVTEVHRDGMMVVWENSDKTLFKMDASEVQLFYVATVHLLQGSEFPSVVVPCSDVKTMMNLLDRRWLYTACTRAKSRVIVIATRDIDAFVRKNVFDIQASGIKI